MQNYLIAPSLVASVALFLTVSLRSPAATPATAPAAATRPAVLPDASQVPALDDAGLCALYAVLYPKPDDDFGGYALDDPLAKLKEITSQELRERGAKQLASYLAKPKAPDLALADEAMVLMLLHGAIFRRFDDPPVPHERLEPIARRAVVLGRYAREVALAKYRLADAAWMSDGLLRELLPNLRGQKSGWSDRGRNRERVLGEIVRRGGPAWEHVLATEFAEIRQQAAASRGIEERLRSTPTLETLCALRRVQGKGDPLKIEVAGPAKIQSVFPALPEVQVALVNGDPGNETIEFTEGGNYRSGRQARWRVEARNAAGNLFPERAQLDGTGGGLFNEGELASGARWKTSLRMESFVAALPPGQYSIRILYHDSVCIADEADVDGLILFSSDPITLTVLPMEIPQGDVDAAKVRELLASIDDKRKPKVVAGTYGKWAHEFLSPDSAQGKLLALGLPAVPPLLETLEDPKLTTTRRAVVLSLLFSLTGQVDPRDATGVLGNFDSAQGPWAISNGESTSFGWGSSSVILSGAIDETAQKTFAKRWGPWKQYVKVVPTAGGKAVGAGNGGRNIDQ